MAENLFEKVGQFDYKELLAEAEGTLQAVVLKPGGGDIARGTVLVRDEEGFYAPAAAAAIAPTAMMAVLSQDASTGDAASGEGIPATAYTKGVFLRGKLKLASDEEMTLAALAVLNNVGIETRQSIASTGEMELFENTVSPGA